MLLASLGAVAAAVGTVARVLGLPTVLSVSLAVVVLLVGGARWAIARRASVDALASVMSLGDIDPFDSHIGRCAKGRSADYLGPDGRPVYVRRAVEKEIAHALASKSVVVVLGPPAAGRLALRSNDCGDCLPSIRSKQPSS